MTNQINYDYIIIGGGHNGLTCAAYLAKAGKRVLVLERRDTLGGMSATEELWPGFHVDTGAPNASHLLEKVIDELDLAQYGLSFIENPVRTYAPSNEGQALVIHPDPERTTAKIARTYPEDAKRYIDFAKQVEMFAGILRQIFVLTPPDMSGPVKLESLPWAKFALNVKGLGDKEMMEFLRVLPMPVWEFLDEWFESDILKGALAATATTGTMLGPKGAGTTLNFLFQHAFNDRGGTVRGGVGKVVEALSRAAQSFGVEIRCGAAVEKIIVENRIAVGIRLSGGEEIRAGAVVSGISPRDTFLQALDPEHLPIKDQRRVRNIRYRGSTAAIHLGLGGLPAFAGNPTEDILSGEIVICPSLAYLERAYDDAKYGRFSAKPMLRMRIPTILDPLLAPEGKHILSIRVQYAPHGLDWEKEKDAFGKTVLRTLFKYAPELTKLIEHVHVITPLDWEREYGAPEGNIFHGQMGLDQLLFMRPIAGWARYKTPVKNLYLCGASAHPGGGVTGAPGYNAAREILKSRG